MRKKGKTHVVHFGPLGSKLVPPMARWLF
jgi:hypothetical protein